MTAALHPYWPWCLRTAFIAMLGSATVLVWLHPGLAAIRFGLGLVYALPALLLFPAAWRLRPRALAATSFYAILLLMPILAELWAEPQIRRLALLSCGLCLLYLALVVVYLRRAARATNNGRVSASK